MIKLNTDKNIINQIHNNILKMSSNIQLPKNFVRLKQFTGKPKYIVIHDSNCLNHTDATLDVDTERTAMGALKRTNISKGNLKDLNYHYVIDRIGKDYEIISGRPISAQCNHPDIEKVFPMSLHVIILFDMNVEIPINRLYQIISYRCLAPLIRMLKLGSPNNVIKFHDDGNEKSHCPGEFLAKELLVAQVRRYI